MSESLSTKTTAYIETNDGELIEFSALAIIDEFKEFNLADPEFYSNRRVELLIGEETAHKLLLPKQSKKGDYFIQHSRVGDLIMGGSGGGGDVLRVLISLSDECQIGQQWSAVERSF